MIWNMGDGHRLLHVGSYHFCVLLWRPLSARSSDSTTTPILYCGGEGQPRTESGQDGDDESGVDMFPRCGDAARTGLAQGRAISPTP